MELIDTQFQIDGGFIDILARDKNGVLTIIELKVKDHDKRLIYQCAYYPIHFNEPTRIICIAPNYTYKLYYSLKNIKGVELKVYNYINGKLVIKDFDPSVLKIEEKNKIKELIEYEKLKQELYKKIDKLLSNVKNKQFVYLSTLKELANQLKLSHDEFENILKERNLCAIKNNSKIFDILKIMGFEVNNQKYIIVNEKDIHPVFKEKFKKYIDYM